MKSVEEIKSKIVSTLLEHFACGPDVITSYDDSRDAEWHNDAIEEWNKRSDK